jgi:hypothetical protein
MAPSSTRDIQVATIGLFSLVAGGAGGHDCDGDR